MSRWLSDIRMHIWPKGVLPPFTLVVDFQLVEEASLGVRDLKQTNT